MKVNQVAWKLHNQCNHLHLLQIFRKESTKGLENRSQYLLKFQLSMPEHLL